MTRRLPSVTALSRRRASGGFTLIELLVAVTVMGLMTVVLFGGLRFGTRAWEAGDARAERLAEVETVHGLLRRQLMQAMVPAAAPDAGGFVGTAERMRFTAPAPTRLGPGGLYRFELAVVEERGVRRLDLAWRLYRPDADDEFAADTAETETAGARTLIEGVAEARLAYYGATVGDGTLDWRESWDEPQRLPSLVAVELSFPEGDGRVWPLLVAAPRVATGSATESDQRPQALSPGEAPN